METYDIAPFDIEWLDWYNPEAKSDVFYCDGYDHHPVCVVKATDEDTGEDTHILISVDGEMRLDYLDPITRETHYIRNSADLAEIGITKDSDLVKLDGIDWGMSPWFDAYDITVDYAPKDGIESLIHLDMVSGDLDEIIQKVVVYLKTEKGLQ